MEEGLYIVLGIVFYHPERDDIAMYQLDSYKWYKDDGSLNDLAMWLKIAAKEILKKKSEGWIHIGEL